mgnify:CR=1 FL=1
MEHLNSHANQDLSIVDVVGIIGGDDCKVRKPD